VCQSVLTRLAAGVARVCKPICSDTLLRRGILLSSEPRMLPWMANISAHCFSIACAFHADRTTSVVSFTLIGFGYKDRYRRRGVEPVGVRSKYGLRERWL